MLDMNFFVEGTIIIVEGTKILCVGAQDFPFLGTTNFSFPM